MPNDHLAKRILLVDGDDQSGPLLRAELTRAGYQVARLSRNEDAIEVLENLAPHLVVLDWDLPGVVTFNLVRHVNGGPNRQLSPRLMALSSYSGEQQIVSGLEHGLDDYVVKPFSVAEVLARIRALLRHCLQREPEREAESVLRLGALIVDLADNRVIVDNKRVNLRGSELRLLAYLMAHPERAFTREQLLHRAWHRQSANSTRAVDVTVQRIRRALRDHGWGGELQTVRGVGYRLSALPAPPDSGG